MIAIAIRATAVDTTVSFLYQHCWSWLMELRSQKSHLHIAVKNDFLILAPYNSMMEILKTFK